MSNWPKFAFIVILITFCSLTGQERLLRPGDAIEIIVPQTKELSQIVHVGPDGTIEFPGMQGLPVDGFTLQRFREVLVTQLGPYMGSTPLVLVRFSESYPIRVKVLGQVALPGLHEIPNIASLQGAITAAGGLMPGAQLSRIKIISTKDDKKSEQMVNMEKFYLDGDPSDLPVLKDDDLIIVPGNPLATRIKVLGAVTSPGSYEILFQTSLLDAIFLAGGPKDDANLNKVIIVSAAGERSQQISINIKHLLKSKKLTLVPSVQPGDVIYVPNKILSWRKLFDVVRDFSALVSIYYLIDITQNNRSK
jgi:protein involved in polysaccharide export with SLBB domain